MRNPEATSKFVFILAAASLLLLEPFAIAGSAANAHAADSETYEWSAQLVSLDEGARIAVLQARVEPYSDIEGLGSFTDGDQLTLIWLGRSWAAGIRNLTRDPELSPQTLSLPVEFVTVEDEGKYVNFRIPVPANSVVALAAMKPGDRVTGVSPKMARDRASAITRLRAYNDISGGQ